MKNIPQILHKVEYELGSVVEKLEVIMFSEGEVKKLWQDISITYGWGIKKKDGIVLLETRIKSKLKMEKLN